MSREDSSTMNIGIVPVASGHGADAESNVKSIVQAVRSLNSDVLNAMVDQGCNKDYVVYAVNKYSDSIFKNDKDRVTEFFKSLIANGILFDARTADLAFVYGNFDVVSDILASGVSMDNFLYEIYKHPSVIRLRSDQMEYLDQLGAVNYTEKEFIRACRCGELAEVKKFVEKGFDVNMIVDGKTLLELIYDSGSDCDDINRAAMAIFLVNHGALITERFKNMYPDVADNLQIMTEKMEKDESEKAADRKHISKPPVLPPQSPGKYTKKNELLR